MGWVDILKVCAGGGVDFVGGGDIVVHELVYIWLEGGRGLI